MAKKKRGKGYLNAGLPKIVNLIVAIIPGVQWIIGCISRLIRGNILGAILELTGIGSLILQICDIVTILKSNDIKVLA